MCIRCVLQDYLASCRRRTYTVYAKSTNRCRNTIISAKRFKTSGTSSSLMILFKKGGPKVRNVESSSSLKNKGSRLNKLHSVLSIYNYFLT